MTSFLGRRICIAAMTYSDMHSVNERRKIAYERGHMKGPRDRRHADEVLTHTLFRYASHAISIRGIISAWDYDSSLVSGTQDGVPRRVPSRRVLSGLHEVVPAANGMNLIVTM